MKIPYFNNVMTHLNIPKVMLPIKFVTSVKRRVMNKLMNAVRKTVSLKPK